MALSSGGLPFAVADTGALSNAIASRETEVRLKREDIAKVEREVEALSHLIAEFPTARNDLLTATAQLEAAEAKLQEIQAANLVRSIISLGMKTYLTAQAFASLGSESASRLLNTGVRSAVGYVVAERLLDQIQEGSKAKLGLDDNSLLSPRTQKVKILNENVRQVYPQLKRVQRTLALSLDAVKGIAFNANGTVLGDTGAIYRKNLMAQEEIRKAVDGLRALEEKARQAKEEAELSLPGLQSELEELRQELSALEADLANLKRQLKEEEYQEERKELEARIVPPVNRPSPAVSVPQQPPETYVKRLAEAKRQAAEAIWAAESPALFAEIASLQQQVTEADSALASAERQASGAAEIANTFKISRRLAPTEKLDPASLAEVLEFLQEIDKARGEMQSRADELVPAAENLAGLYTQLQNAQNRLWALVVMVERDAPPRAVGNAFVVPGRGISAVLEVLTDGEILLENLPVALANVSRLKEEAESASLEMPTACARTFTLQAEDLEAAELALQRLIQHAKAWEAALAELPEAANDHGIGYGFWREVPGLEDNAPFVQVLRRKYSHAEYAVSFARLLASGSSSDLELALGLRARHAAFHGMAESLQRAYHEALLEFRRAWAALSPRGGNEMVDWHSHILRAGNNLSGLPKKDDVRQFSRRFERLLWTAGGYYHLTNLDGSEPPVPGQPVRPWYGLPHLASLETDAIDEYQEVAVHRICDVRNRISEAMISWMKLPPKEFDARLAAFWEDHHNLAYNFTGRLQSELPGWSLSQDYLNEHERALRSIILAIGELSMAYDVANPAPVITSEPRDVDATISEGQEFTTELRIGAAGNFASYRWQRTRWPDYSYTWEDVLGGNSEVLKTPAATETWYYRCVVSNRAGQVASNPVAVRVQVKYPDPKILTPSSAIAHAGQAFKWKFRADIPVSWWMVHPSDGQQHGTWPAGLEFDSSTATLKGSPSVPGNYTLQVGAWGRGGALGTQIFRLFILNPSSNPFEEIELEKNYAGVIIGAEPFRNEQTGFIKMAVSKAGVVSGKVELGGDVSSFRGKFSGDGTAQLDVHRRGLPSLHIELQMDFAEEAISGKVQLGSDGVMMDFRAAGVPVVRKHPLAGRYTVLISLEEAQGFGTGSGSLEVSSRGQARLATVLPDGTKAVYAGWVNKEDELPIYLSLYSGGGFLCSVFSFDEVPEVSDGEGEAEWVRPASTSSSRSSFYRDGFQKNLDILASRYVPPAAGSRALEFSQPSENVVLELTGGNLLAGVIQRTLTWSVKNRIGEATKAAPAFTAKLNRSTGILSGRFLHDQLGRQVTFTGAVFQKQNRADGCFLGVDEAGNVSLIPK